MTFGGCIVSAFLVVAFEYTRSVTPSHTALFQQLQKSVHRIKHRAITFPCWILSLVGLAPGNLDPAITSGWPACSAARGTAFCGVIGWQVRCAEPGIGGGWMANTLFSFLTRCFTTVLQTEIIRNLTLVCLCLTGWLFIFIGFMVSVGCVHKSFTFLWGRQTYKEAPLPRILISRSTLWYLAF